MEASVTQDRSTHRAWVTLAILMSMFMTAIEITIVATAMPRIVADLGGFAQLSWVFSAYLLTQVVFIPIYGKLADLYGRKPVFIFGVVLFLIASVLCGLSRSMTQLIVFRFLQGIGGGAVQPIAVTIVGDLFQPHERHKIQGWLGSVFAFSSLVGPTLGAFITGWGHWPWIFYLNVPLGLVAILILWFFLHEEKRSRSHKIDVLGAALLIACVTVLMLALLEGGTAWPWLSWQTLACLAVSGAFGYFLLKQEARAPEPILPLWVFKRRLIAMTGVATFVNGAMIIGYSAMVPTHVQGVLGRSALTGGLVLGAMSIGWPLASFFAGRIIGRIGYKKAAILGSSALLVGAIGALALSHTSAVGLGIAVFIVGAGLGLQSNAYIITIQSNVPWSERGVATANNLFMRTLGSSVGVAAFGGILNSTISNYLGRSGAGLAGAHGIDSVNQLLRSTGGELDAGARAKIIEALSSGMTAVFIAAIIGAAICVLFTLKLPAEAHVPQEKS